MFLQVFCSFQWYKVITLKSIQGIMMSVSQSVTSALEHSTNETMPFPLPADNIEVPFKFQVLIVSFSAFGIPGNIGAILVLLSDVHLRQKVVNIFMIHQSLIDLCGCVCTLLTAIITDASLVSPGKNIGRGWDTRGHGVPF